MIAQLDKAFDMFVESKAVREGRAEADIRKEIAPSQFYEEITRFHKQFMKAEISFGYMAEQLGVGYFTLNGILNDLGLPATQGW